ncbi:ABC transporter permease [Glycomyces sp. A-F 0318]|uniref:ABC transporter permease n=1 Tax=Glycomyces amatae TaxID=2881355 RepID=UPI001E61AA9A|nr:ABC transporter permease [Glycomyces amatae]MCD0445283.1 ABC transporter permease [Glycomyces amatae]
MGGLRLALRIARREAMRYKGRSVLSITLLGIPILGVAIGASAYDTIDLSAEETAEQHLGENDAYIEPVSPGEPITQYTWDGQYPWYDMTAPAEGEEEEAAPASLTDMEVLAALPVGSWVVPYDLYGGEEAQVETPDGVGGIGVVGYDLADRTYEAAGLEYLEGSAPVRDEVVLTAAAAEYLEVGVGDSITLVGGASDEEHEVSGIIEVPWDLNGRYAIASFFPDSSSGWLVDVPEELTYEDALALNEIGVTVWATSLLDRPSTAPDDDFVMSPDDDYLLTIYALIVVVVVMEVVLLAGPAFAISTRRRSREFALMSANGATPAQIRNTVLAGGALFGIIAAVAAIAIGVAAVAIGMPWLEQLFGHRSAGLRVLPWLQAALVAVAIGTGLLSALAAAVSASRVNVVAALMGRTPGRKGSKRWLVIGLVMVGAGIASGLAGITIWNIQLMAGAIVLLQLGLVSCTPAILALTARLGRWLPLAPRMALREAGRNRGSAAPAIAAVLGVVAGGMAFSMVVAADNVRMESHAEHMLPQGSLTLNLYNQGDYDPETGEMVEQLDWDAAADEAAVKLGQRLDDPRITAIPFYDPVGSCGREAEFPDEEVYCDLALLRPEANMCSYWSSPAGQVAAEGNRPTEEEMAAAVDAAREDPRCDETAAGDGYGIYGVPASTDPDIVAAYTELEGEELDAAVALLEDGGVIVSDPWAVTDAGTAVFEQTMQRYDEGDGSSEAVAVYEVELPAMAVDKELLGYSGVFLGPGAAERLGMAEWDWGRTYLVETSTVVDSAVVEGVNEDLGGGLADGGAAADVAMTDYNDPFTFYVMLAVAGLCALITLGSTAVSTGLIIAEQRQDMTTLGAVGAGPGLRKRFAMWQTVMIALFGAVLGTVAGVLGYALIREALNRPLQSQYPFETLYGWELPWANFAIILLAVPVIAAIGALVFTKARLPSERRLT